MAEEQQNYDGNLVLESALCQLSGCRLTTVAQWQEVQILNSSWGTQERLIHVHNSRLSLSAKEKNSVTRCRRYLIGISYGGGRGNPARGNESEWAGLILFYQECSLRHFINWSSSLSTALCFFLLRWGTVCKSPQCNIMGPKDNHTCATLQSVQTSTASVYASWDGGKLSQQKNSHNSILSLHLFIQKDPECKVQWKWDTFLANVFLTITQMYSCQ